MLILHSFSCAIIEDNDRITNFVEADITPELGVESITHTDEDEYPHLIR